MSEKETKTQVWLREHKETWNAAIEAAIKVVNDLDYPCETELRKLKK